jgi:diaminopimelate decarboxylase
MMPSEPEPVFAALPPTRPRAAAPGGGLSWAQLQVLAAEHGEGFWLLDCARFRENLESFVAAFTQAGLPDVRVAWSVKTSWLPPILRIAMECGALLEVVSRDEFELVLALGAEPESIIFNGPLKTTDDLDRACGLGALVNLDNAEEADDLLELARNRARRHFRVGLRVNLDIGQADRGRFGIDADSIELRQVFGRLAAQPNITIEALHLHVSGARDADAFARRAGGLAALAAELWPGGDGPAQLDIGGGFAGPMPDSLARQLSTPPATWAEYAQAIAKAIRARWPGDGPTLIVEPGMALAGDVMRFAAKVGATKSIAGIRHAIVTASVLTVKPTLHELDMPFEVVRLDGRPAPAGRMVVSGWTCIEFDVLSRDSPFELERGDWLLFDNCGAYTFVLSPRFIRGAPAILAKGPVDEWMAVRRRDDLHAWLAPFERDA